MITDEELNKGLSVLKAVWSAMLISLGIYLFVGLQIAADMPSPMNEKTFGMLKMVIYIVALALLIVTRVVRKKFLSGKGENSLPTGAFRHPALQRYSTATILALAMSESVGILGLVLFFLGKDPMDLYLLILVSAAAMFMYRPSKEEAVTLFRQWRREPTL